jgi:hypothetical protein
MSGGVLSGGRIAPPGTAFIYGAVTLSCTNLVATDPGAGPPRLPECAQPPM